MTANIWANPGDRNPWTVLDQRLHQANVTAQQVQVAWVKQALAGPAGLGEFPKHAEVLKKHMVTLLNKLHEKFPSLHIAYLSSRIYGGYATTPLNPEPYAYESAFAVRWLIEDQITGEGTQVTAIAMGAIPMGRWGEGQKSR